MLGTAACCCNILEPDIVQDQWELLRCKILSTKSLSDGPTIKSSNIQKDTTVKTKPVKDASLWQTVPAFSKAIQ